MARITRAIVASRSIEEEDDDDDDDDDDDGRCETRDTAMADDASNGGTVDFNARNSGWRYGIMSICCCVACVFLFLFLFSSLSLPNYISTIGAGREGQLLPSIFD